MSNSIVFAAMLGVFAANCQVKSGSGPAANAATSSVAETLGNPHHQYYSRTDTTPLHLADSTWRRLLSEDLYAVSREKDTERPFKGKYWNFTGIGTYYCAACGNALFRSDEKFASSCGWPSFFEMIRPTAASYVSDHTFGMERIEVLCGRCGGHLGHIFDDGPPPTGKRFCMNSICLEFEPNK